MARPTSRVSRVLMTGPLAPFVDAYRERLKERRYTPLSAVNLQRQMAQMSRWLEAEGLGVEQLSEAHIEAFVSFQRASGRERSSLSRPGLRVPARVVARAGRGGSGGRADAIADRGADGLVPALPAVRAWPVGGHRPRLCGPCDPVRGRTGSRRTQGM